MPAPRQMLLCFVFLLKHDSIHQKFTQYLFVIIEHILWRARLAICISSLMVNAQ